MNDEDLKIVLKADTSQFDAGMKKADKSLDKFSGSCDEAESSLEKVKRSMASINKVVSGLDKAMTTVFKGLAGVATALGGLSKATEGVRESQAKLSSAFKSAGASAKTAQDTYNGLYRVLGEDDRSVEAANHLAKITTNEQELAEWTKICEGVFATFGDSLPIEGLTEAVNETIKTGKVVGVLADALNWAGVSEDVFNAKLANTSSLEEREAMIRGTLNGLYMNAANVYEAENQAVLRQNEAHAQLNQTLAQLNSVISPAITSILNLANSILQALAPAIQFAATLISYLAEAIAKLFGLRMTIGGTTNTIKPLKLSMLKTADSADKFAGSMAGAAGSAKQIRKALAGFDELNVIADQNVGGMGGGIHLPEPQDNTPIIPNMNQFVDGIPAINTGLEEFNENTGWLEEHHDGVVNALEGLTVGYLGLKGVKGIGSIIGKISAAMGGGAAAAGGASAAAGTLGATLGEVALPALLAVGLAVLGVAIGMSDGGIPAIMGFDDAAVQLFEDMRNLDGEFDELHGQTLESDDAILQAREQAVAYAHELDNLCDSSGKVASKDEERVRLLLAKLNPVLGTNLQLIDGQIVGYDQLGMSVEDLAEAESAVALIQSHQPEYTKALEAYGKAQDAVLVAEDAISQADKEREYWTNKKTAAIRTEQEAQLKLRKLHENHDQMSNVEYDHEKQRLEMIIEKQQSAVESAETELGQLNEFDDDRMEKLEEAKETEMKYKTELDTFKQAQLLAEQGYYKESCDLITGKMSLHESETLTMSEETHKRLNDLQYFAEQSGEKARLAREEFYKGTSGYTLGMVEELEETAQKFQEKYDTAYDEAHTAGANLGKGLQDGLDSESPNFVNKAAHVMRAGLNAMRYEAQIASPSKKTRKFGKFIGIGLEEGMKNTEAEVNKAAEKLADVSLKPIETSLEVASFDSKISVEDTLKANYKQNTIDYHSDLSKLGQILTNRQDKIAINIDGKELGWATIHSINDITHQTGNLQLSII